MTVLSKQLTPLDKAEIARGIHNDKQPPERAFCCGFVIRPTIEMVDCWKKQQYTTGYKEHWDEWYNKATIRDWVDCWDKYSYTTRATGFRKSAKQPIDNSYYEYLKNKQKQEMKDKLDSLSV